MYEDMIERQKKMEISDIRKELSIQRKQTALLENNGGETNLKKLRNSFTFFNLNHQPTLSPNDLTRSSYGTRDYKNRIIFKNMLM